MSEHITLSAQAYCKIILHAAKYPHCAINGILLAKTSSKTKEITYEEAVPLFHMSIMLTPMSEVALPLIDTAFSKYGLCIAGYYTAHENLRENSFEKAENKITEKITSNFNHPCIVVVDNTKIASGSVETIKVSQFSDGAYRPCEAKRVHVEPEKAREICAQLISEEKYNMLNDFDDHLDDIKLDWMNLALSGEIERLL